MFPDLRTGADLRCLRARIDRSAARQGTWLRNPLTVGVQVAKGTRSPFIPANGWLGCSHRGDAQRVLVRLSFLLFVRAALPESIQEGSSGDRLECLLISRSKIT